MLVLRDANAAVRRYCKRDKGRNRDDGDRAATVVAAMIVWWRFVIIAGSA